MEKLQEQGVEVTHLEESGEAAGDIVADAETHDVDLIVVGGRKRSPAGKVLFGSVSQSVILNTERPVAITGAGME